MSILVLSLLLGMSCALNVWGALYLKKFQSQVDAAKKRPAPTLTAEELIHDLTRGPAVVRIERIDSTELFMRSPRA